MKSFVVILSILAIIFLLEMDQVYRSTRRPTPKFLEEAVDLSIPRTAYDVVDLNTVDPQYRSIYQTYNDTVRNLEEMDRVAREQAVGQGAELKNLYERGATRAENRFINQKDVIRQGAEDARLSNRLRARASGGGLSSGMMELENRIDRDAVKNIANASGEYTGALSDLELKALQGINAIRDDLNQKITSIVNNRGLSLRERDLAIAKAQEEARRAAELSAYYQSLEGNTSSTNQGGQVLGDSTQFEIDTGTYLPDLGINVTQWGDVDEAGVRSILKRAGSPTMTRSEILRSLGLAN